MSVHTGPNNSENGLVFYYDMGNTQKSWKGKPTTNLIFSQSLSYSYYAYVSGNPTDTYALDRTNTNKLCKRYTISSAVNTARAAFYPSSLSTGVDYVFTFYIKYNGINVSTPTLYADASKGNPEGGVNNNTFNSAVFTTTLVGNNWYHCVYKFNFATCPTNKCILAFGIGTGTDTAYVNNTFDIYDAQFETGTFSTPYVEGVRSNTQSIIDLTSTNTITASSLTYASDNTFSFNGSTDYVETSSSSIFDFTNGTYLRASSGYTWTVSAWFKFPVSPTNAKTGNAAYVICGQSGGIGGGETFTLFVGSGTDATYGSYVPYYCAVGIFGTKTIISPSSVNTNTWNNVVVTWDGTNGRVYFNGVDRGALNIGTASLQTGYYFTVGMTGNTGTLSSVMCFEGSISTVSVYTRSLSSYEVQSNFNALRGRFGL